MSGLLLNKIKINISLMDTLNFGDGYNFTLFEKDCSYDGMDKMSNWRFM